MIQLKKVRTGRIVRATEYVIRRCSRCAAAALAGSSPGAGPLDLIDFGAASAVAGGLSQAAALRLYRACQMQSTMGTCFPVRYVVYIHTVGVSRGSRAGHAALRVASVLLCLGICGATLAVDEEALWRAALGLVSN